MSTAQEVWFKLFACCIIVKGATESLIYDVQRGSFFGLPNAYLGILTYAKTHSIIGLKGILEYDGETVDAFFNQFVEAELGFYTLEPESFPAIDLSWHSPYKVTNSILEYATSSDYNFSDVVAQLQRLGCDGMQVRLLDEFSFDKIKSLLSAFKSSRVKHIELLIPFTENISKAELHNLMASEFRLNRILVYASPEEYIMVNESESRKVAINFTKDIRKDQTEIVRVERFNTNLKSFTEAQAYNLALNRKVCVDKDGEIRNYITHNYSYGNVKNINIASVISDNEFMWKWNTSNDLIEKCKDCQYRYACVNNSDLYRIDGKVFKETYCDFDPYHTSSNN